MLRSINLSLSSACGADCVYCPKRGGNISSKLMSFDVAKRVVDEISSPEFKEEHAIENIEVGENGDAFLNKDAVEILRYIKKKLPSVKVSVFTNFRNFTEDTAGIMLRERLVDRVACNIDAATPDGYYSVKRTDHAAVEKNLKYFLKVRRETAGDVPLTIFVLTMKDYIRAIRGYTGYLPIKLPGRKRPTFFDELPAIKRQWMKHLDPAKDKISKAPFIVAWAERERAAGRRKDLSGYSCPMMERVREEAFIAPDGTWYACCYDADFELAFGNAAEEGVNRIYHSVIREEFIKKLENRGFSGISGPCATVDFCQPIFYEGRARTALKKLIRRLRSR